MQLYVQTNTYQQAIKLLDQNRHHSQQTHADGKIRFFNWCWRRWSAGTLSEFYVWRKELDHKRAYSFFEEETEFLMLFAKEKKNSLSLQHPSKHSHANFRTYIMQSAHAPPPSLIPSILTKSPFLLFTNLFPISIAFSFACSPKTFNQYQLCALVWKYQWETGHSLLSIQLDTTPAPLPESDHCQSVRAHAPLTIT